MRETQPTWRPSGIVSLLSDFGQRDPYVGIMKGVLYARAPGLRALVDLTHDVPPQDVFTAAFFLAAAWSWFPEGTLHVAVVDPEVGSERELLLVACRGHLVLAPDNGLIEGLLVAEPGAIVRRVLADAVPFAGTSSTFHGRDRFAPLAAALVAGARPEELSEPCASFRRLPLRAPEREPDGSLRAEVVLVDHYGNLVTNAAAELLGGGALAGRWTCEIAGRRIPLLRTYADAAPGELVALIDSYDRVEIAVRDGDAARELDLGRGAGLRLEPAGEGA